MFDLKIKGKGNKRVVTMVEYPGGVYQIVCTIGHLIVLAGAISKGKSEIREMTNVGIRKYFRTTVTSCIFNVFHKAYIYYFQLGRWLS